MAHRNRFRPQVACYGTRERVLAATTALEAAGFKVVANAVATSPLAAVIIGCPDADQDASCFCPHLPALQDLSFQLPARRVVIVDLSWDARHDRLIPMERGMTGIPKPVGEPKRGDPWQVNLLPPAKSQVGLYEPVLCAGE